MATSSYYMYVLYCADDTLYCGFTNNVMHRLTVHQRRQGAKYTRVKSRHPLRLIYQEKFPTKHAALSAEYHFKHQSRQKKKFYLAEHGVDIDYYYQLNHSQTT